MPTLQKKVSLKAILKEAVANGGKIEPAVVKAGLSKAYARSGKLQKTKGWKELLEKYIPDGELMKKHSEQLNSSKHHKLYFDIDDDDEMIKKVCKKLGVDLLYIKVSKDKSGKTANVKEPDFFFRDLALEKAYKLKGRYLDDKDKGGNKTLIVVVTGETVNRYAIPLKPEDSSARPS